jgi:hypothetical protein
MKYVKLFEDFRKYDLVKDFPPQGCCACSTPEEADALCEMLESAKYVNANQDLGSILRNKEKYLNIIWQEKHYSKEYYRMSDDLSKFSIEIKEKEIKFKDYFKFKTEYRGHNLKKFGV